MITCENYIDFCFCSHEDRKLWGMFKFLCQNLHVGQWLPQNNFEKQGLNRGKIRFTEENAKCRHLKKLPVKGERRGATVHKAMSKIST